MRARCDHWVSRPQPDQDLIAQFADKIQQLADIILRNAADVVILDPIAFHPARI